jgi:hypothetical protein
MNKSSSYSPLAKCYQKNKGLVLTITVAGSGRYPARGGDGGALAAGTVVRGAVEVRSVILKRLVRLRDRKHLALMAHLITSNHLRSE